MGYVTSTITPTSAKVIVEDVAEGEAVWVPLTELRP